MTTRFANHRVVDLIEATSELRDRRRALRAKSRRASVTKARSVRLPTSALWVIAFYSALAACTALWWHWSAVGLPRLLMGTPLLFAVLLATGREVVWTHPVCILLVPAAFVVAAFFFYPLAPTAAVVALVFIANMLWFG
jgi:hypothetical protein